ncbi:MAG: hypothetical protein R2853_05275 [Thermomicrobiales bacterium]
MCSRRLVRRPDFPGSFYAESIEAAAQRLGRRVLLLAGLQSPSACPRSPEGSAKGRLRAHAAAAFPRAAAIVHQGGIGTIGAALRAGKPTIIVPFAHDQFDNARRSERPGSA